MALPYPSMNFVPLDVLTAAQQNQLVANIEYLNTQLTAANTELSKRNWYCVGEVSATNSSVISVDFPNGEPWGIEVRAAIELSSGEASWCDIVAYDSSNNPIQCFRHYSTSNGLYNQGSLGNPFATIPVFSINGAGSCIARSVKSASWNWRTWTWHSTGGSSGTGLESWSGGSRQQSGTAIHHINLAASGTGNLYLGVWAHDYTE